MEQPHRLLHCLLPGQTGICHHELRIKKEAEDFLCLLKLHCEETFLFRVSGFSRALTLHLSISLLVDFVLVWDTVVLEA